LDEYELISAHQRKDLPTKLLMTYRVLYTDRKESFPTPEATTLLANTY
jgi:uncharacterized short protein YbdD (DUF466 family)